jgi:hypothetical protein
VFGDRTGVRRSCVARGKMGPFGMDQCRICAVGCSLEPIAAVVGRVASPQHHQECIEASFRTGLLHLCDTPRGACRMTYGIEKPERMAGQGRVAATAGRRGPQRSEDTGQAWRTLDVAGAERASRRGSREVLSPCSPTPRGRERGLGQRPKSSATFRPVWQVKIQSQKRRSPLGIAGGRCAPSASLPPALPGAWRGCAPRLEHQGPGYALKSSPVRCSGLRPSAPRAASGFTLDPQTSPKTAALAGAADFQPPT